MIRVIKKNGDTEYFDEDKVRRSLRNSSASEDTINKILRKLNKNLYDRITTEEIFKWVYKELRKVELLSGTKYNLKQGIIDMTLGGGFVFEKFIARMFERLGYYTELNIYMPGRNIEHEIDVILEKNRKRTMVECKHFTKSDLGISIQTALYVYARFLDLKKHFDKALLVTNTKFSHQVIEYSKGVKLELLGWKYPLEQGLDRILEENRLYPITILHLKKHEIREYLKRNILFVDELIDVPEIRVETRELIQKLIKK